MIELRWVSHGNTVTDRLQYRFMMTVNPNVSVWSDWLDVPKVRA